MRQHRPGDRGDAPVPRKTSGDHGPGPLRTEGLDEAHWVLLDFGEFVAHIFHEPSREYYDLERLWSDVPRHEFG